jgi:hypothetical protein
VNLTTHIHDFPLQPASRSHLTLFAELSTQAKDKEGTGHHNKSNSQTFSLYWYHLICHQNFRWNFSDTQCASKRRMCNKKGKSVPLQAWNGPEGSRKLRFPDYTTTAQNSGKVVSLTHRPPLPPGNAPGTHFC